MTHDEKHGAVNKKHKAILKAKCLCFNLDAGVVMHVMRHANTKAHSALKGNDQHTQVCELQYAK